MAKGDLLWIDALLQRYVDISPTVDAALKYIVSMGVVAPSAPPAQVRRSTIEPPM